MHFLLLQVDSANKHGILLEVVQVLTDLNLIITKAYICSDGNWFMDGKILSSKRKTPCNFISPPRGGSNIILHVNSVSVFNITDQNGNKVVDEGILDYIRSVSGSFVLGISFFTTFLFSTCIDLFMVCLI